MSPPAPRRPSRRAPAPDPSAAWRRVRLALRDHGLLLEADATLSNVAALVAGAPVRGSWWSHPAGRVIYAVTQMLERHPDALSVRLLGGKVTWVHRRLWPSLVAVATAGSDWQTAGLSPAARRLLAQLQRAGEVQVSGPAARELQERLLAVGVQVHTEDGHHELRLQTWERWTAGDVMPPPALSPEHGAHLIEEAARTLGGEAAVARLPWQRKRRVVAGRPRKSAARLPKKSGTRRPRRRSPR